MLEELAGGRTIDRAARTRDRLARLASAFETEYAGLLRFAYFVSGDRSTAEDLVQEAFVRIYQAGDRVDATRLNQYARRTVLNLHRSSLRRLALRRSHVRMEEDSRDPADQTGQLQVRSALMTLRPGERACLALRFYEDMPDRDIAETLGISISAVKKRMQRGLQKVRSILGEDETS
jgi:RNA polymerase sigma factor (sigma-70 family)